MGSFGSELAGLLAAEGISQSELARRTGIARTVIVEIIGGSDRHELKTYAPRIVDALGLPALRAWMAHTRGEVNDIATSLRENRERLDAFEKTIERAEAAQRDLAAARVELTALSTELAEAKRMFAAEQAALATGRQLLDKLSEQVEATR